MTYHYGLRVVEKPLGELLFDVEFVCHFGRVLVVSEVELFGLLERVTKQHDIPNLLLVMVGELVWVHFKLVGKT